MNRNYLVSNSARIAVIATLAFALGACAKGTPFERTGVVRRASVASPVRAGAACHVAVTNESRGGFPCRVSVVCEGHTLYGGAQLGGWAECEAENHQWVEASDDKWNGRDGDPWMHFDVRRGVLLVRDDNGTDLEIAVGDSASRVAQR